jgi:hypothetical protein
LGARFIGGLAHVIAVAAVLWLFAQEFSSPHFPLFALVLLLPNLALLLAFGWIWPFARAQIRQALGMHLWGLAFGLVPELFGLLIRVDTRGELGLSAPVSSLWNMTPAYGLTALILIGAALGFFVFGMDAAMAAFGGKRFD